MIILEIKQNTNGSHENQNGEFLTIPQGYALLPSSIKTPNFPFGDIEVSDIDGIPTVTSWTPLPLPEVEPVESLPTLEEQFADLAEYVDILSDFVLGGMEE